MRTYPKRKFESISEIGSSMAFLAGHWKPLLELVSGRGPVNPAFRERIMLAVTSVNDCRYCSFVHSLAALREGFSRHEVKTILRGSFGEVPEEEIEALLFAQHWADTRGHPDPTARSKLRETYGTQRALAIEVAIRAIMLGNYTGNTLDAVLFSCSGGRLAKLA